MAYVKPKVVSFSKEDVRNNILASIEKTMLLHKNNLIKKIEENLNNLNLSENIEEN